MVTATQSVQPGQAVTINNLMTGKLRLGFHYHIPAIFKGDDIYMPGNQGRFIDSLAYFCGKVICFLHSPRPDELDLMDYRIASGNVQLVDLGPHASVMKRTMNARKYISVLRRYASEMDVLLLRGPSPLLPALAAGSPVPTALLLVGDYLNGIDDLPQPRWRKEAIRLWSYWNKWGQNRAARHSLTLVNTRVLHDELAGKVPLLHEIRTTTLTRDDFYTRSDTCRATPIRLLYVGRMDRAKGLLQMVEAVALLIERGEDVVLELVGWQERGDPILEEVRKLADEKKITERVRYLGSRPLGPELFECYRQADIFVNASLASEGFPRTIWEAMASSLPVIATRVGSIPAFIEGASVIIPPRDVPSLADAIALLIHDDPRRQSMIIEGRKLAQENTLEKRSHEMVEIISKYSASPSQ